MRFQVLFVALLVVSGSFAQNSTLDDVFEVFQGFVNGLGQEVDLTDVKTCISNSEEIFDDFTAAVTAFERSSVGSIWTAIQDLCEGLQVLPTAMKDCQGAEQEIEIIAKAISSFRSPLAFFFDIFRHIIINHKDVTTDIQSAVSAFKSQDWQDFGYYVGEAIGVAIFGNPSVNQVTPQDLPDIFEGVLEGIGAQTGYPAIANCITLSNSVAENITIASADIATHQYENVLSGIIIIAQTMQVLPQAIQQCNASITDFENLEAALAVYKNPQSFIFNAGKNLLLNGVNIYHDLQSAASNYESGNWNAYGNSVGQALALVLWGSNSSISVGSDAQNVLDFAYGVLAGIQAASNFDDFVNCIETDETIINLLEQAYNNITEETPASVLQGIVALGQAAQIIPNAIQQCNATYQDFEALVKAIESFQSPISFAYHVGVSLLLNGREIYDEITNAVADYKAQNWTGFGFYVGEAFGTLIIGDDAELSSDYADFVDQRVAWTVAMPSIFSGMTLGDITNNYLGATLDVSDDSATVFDYQNMVVSIPVTFDSRTQWPNCVSQIRTQGNCAASWAIAPVDTLADRLCIASNGTVAVELSPQYIISCDNIDLACNGGNVYNAWAFLASTGTVSETCDPYAESAETCASQCADDSSMTLYTAAKGTLTLLPNAKSIQVDIMNNGPVDAIFAVYEDFLYYNGGVYTQSSGALLGGLSVKIVGWGQENGQNYWIAANSWGSAWGESGYFRVAFGQCGIDTVAVAGQSSF